MKLLLDENLPHQMRLEIVGHEVFTAAYMNWSRIENGELLRLAAGAGFDALITLHELLLQLQPREFVKLAARSADA